VANFRAAIAGGIAGGSWVWGHLATAIGLDLSLLASGASLAISALVGIWLRMPDAQAATSTVEPTHEPEVNLPITGRSGPIVIEIDYRVHEDDAASFHAAMQEIQSIRQRNGAYGWSLARDIAHPDHWCERFRCPTWDDYVRLRRSATESERGIEEEIRSRHVDMDAIRVRRLLERPSGSRIA
jgi:hypothetical protein